MFLPIPHLPLLMVEDKLHCEDEVTDISCHRTIFVSPSHASYSYTLTN
jgi:hypothetical protein